MVCLRSYALLGIAGCAGPDGGLRATGRSRGGAARRNAVRHSRPQAQPGLRAAGRGGRLSPEATWHNVNKPHRPRAHLAAGPELASGGAGRSAVRVKPEQAPQGATGRGLGWCRGPQVDRAA